MKNKKKMMKTSFTQQFFKLKYIFKLCYITFKSYYLVGKNNVTSYDNVFFQFFILRKGRHSLKFQKGAFVFFHKIQTFFYAITLF